MRGIQMLNHSRKIIHYLHLLFCLILKSFFMSDLDTFLSKINMAQKSTSILEFAMFIEPYKNVFQELFWLCKIAVAIPFSLATCEKSFSWLKLIKTHLRTTISEWAEWFWWLAGSSIKCRRAKSEFTNVQKHKSQTI